MSRRIQLIPQGREGGERRGKLAAILKTEVGMSGDADWDYD